MYLSKEVRTRNGIIARISISLLFPFLLIALMIYLSGFKGPIQFDNSYYNFMQAASIMANSWNIKIPDIPTIRLGDDVAASWEIIKVLVQFVNFFISVINVIITIINLVISLFTTIAAIIKLMWEFGEYDFSDSGALSYWVHNGRILLSI